MGLQSQFARCYLLPGQNATVKLEARHFEPEYWQSQNECEVLEGGRGSSYRVEHESVPLVLREYLRGGLVASISRDKYFWTGKTRCRSWRELRILDFALKQGLPVPIPAGALAIRSGLIYRAAILTHWIPDSKSLAQWLFSKTLPRQHWFTLGEILRKFQLNHIHHHDLNANNILIDGDHNIFVIDFDKAEIRNNLGDWQWRTLYRLQRSLVKIDQQSKLKYTDEDWQALMDGYQAK
ncbi:MAG: 3-deoxy-D-manno-octulosonic acid kinase [Gammaproteobacteria bacterium]|jgi:3-deoxy-D-manno-octulosonic acid kinase